MVELRMRKKVMRKDATKNHEKQELKRISCESELTVPDTADRISNPVCNQIDTCLSTPTQGSCTPDLSYPLVSYILVPSSSSSVSFMSTSLSPSQNTKSRHPSASHHVIIISWHEVQRTPSTAYTDYSICLVQYPLNIICHPFIIIIMSSPGNLTSAHSMPPDTIDPHHPALHECSLGKSPCHIQTVASKPADECSQQLARCPLMVSKYLSNLTHVQSPSVAPKVLNHVLQGYLQTCLITASTLAHWWPPTVISRLVPLQAPSFHDQGLHVNISKLAWLWPSSSHNHSLQVCISKSARLRPPSASAHSLNHIHQVHSQIRSITISDCISKSTPSRPQSIFRHTIKYWLPAHLQHCLNTVSMCISKLTQLSFSEAPRYPLMCHLPPVQLSRVLMGGYIDTLMIIQTEYMSFKNC